MALLVVQTEEGPQAEATVPLLAGRGGRGSPRAPGGAGPAHMDSALETLKIEINAKKQSKTFK